MINLDSSAPLGEVIKIYPPPSPLSKKKGGSELC